MAKNAKVESETSSITRSAKNMPLNIAEDAEVDGNGNGGDNKTIKRLPLFKKPNIITEHYRKSYKTKLLLGHARLPS